MLEKEHSRNELRSLKDRLALLFRESFNQKRPVLILCDGNDLITMRRFVRLLLELLDPRHYRVFRDNSPLPGPFLLPFWRALPPRGDCLILLHSYCHAAASARHRRLVTKKRFKEIIGEIEDFESTLRQQGYLLYHMALLNSGNKFIKQLKKIESRKLHILIKKTIREMHPDNADYLKYLNQIFDATAAEPWFNPGIKKYKILEIALLKFLIARLEEDLKIDSARATMEFDSAMQELRQKTREIDDA